MFVEIINNGVVETFDNLETFSFSASVSAAEGKRKREQLKEERENPDVDDMSLLTLEHFGGNYPAVSLVFSIRENGGIKTYSYEDTIGITAKIKAGDYTIETGFDPQNTNIKRYGVEEYRCQEFSLHWEKDRNIMNISMSVWKM